MAKKQKTTLIDFDPLYVVYKNNRKATKMLFDSYEEARRYVRKQLRKLTLDRSHGQPVVPMWTFGYDIRQV